MDQNQPAGTPDNDLQQAIDNISNSTNSDPVFSEPAAPPSPLSDPNQDVFSDPNVGPFPLPDPDTTVGVVTPSPEPIAPLDPISLPDLSVSGENPADAKVVTKAGHSETDPDPSPDSNPAPGSISKHQSSPAHQNTQTESIENHHAGSYADSDQHSSNYSDSDQHAGNYSDSDSNQHANSYSDSNSDQHTADDAAASDAAPSPISAPHSPNSHSEPSSDARQIREAALRELAPILDHANLDPSKKFKVCQDILENLHDSSVLNQAYKAASDIKDENERANSLLYLIESIDSM